MRTVKRFEPVSVMKMSAICYAFSGLLEGALFSVMFSIIPLALPHDAKMPPFVGVIFGGFSIILFPIFFAIWGQSSADSVHWSITWRLGGLAVSRWKSSNS